MTDVEPDHEQQSPSHAGRTAWVGAQIATAQVAGERALAWGVDRVRGVECGLEAYGRERRAGGALLAGGLAYRLFFWLLPLGLLVAAVLSFWQRSDEDGLDDAARSIGMGAAAAQSASEAIASSSSSRWYFLGAGVLFTAYFSLAVVRALRLAHALAWDVPFGRVRRPFAGMILFNGLAIGLMLASAATAWLRNEFGLWGLAVTLSMLAAYGGVALWVMWLLPHDEDVPLRTLLPGAALVALGTEAIHVFVVLYLVPRLGRSSELYGSLGAATVILLWLYVTARLIIAAAFLNATAWRRGTRKPASPTAGRGSVDDLERLVALHAKGAISDEELAAGKARARGA
jgi:uncharacterized BrkB/YihY/UPF0761 family membrane protein